MSRGYLPVAMVLLLIGPGIGDAAGQARSDRFDGVPSPSCPGRLSVVTVAGMKAVSAAPVVLAAPTAPTATPLPARPGVRPGSGGAAVESASFQAVAVGSVLCSAAALGLAWLVSRPFPDTVPPMTDGIVLTREGVFGVLAVPGVVWGAPIGAHMANGGRGHLLVNMAQATGVVLLSGLVGSKHPWVWYAGGAALWLGSAELELRTARARR